MPQRHKEATLLALHEELKQKHAAADAMPRGTLNLGTWSPDAGSHLQHMDFTASRSMLWQTAHLTLKMISALLHITCRFDTCQGCFSPLLLPKIICCNADHIELQHFALCLAHLLLHTTGIAVKVNTVLPSSTGVATHPVWQARNLLPALGLQGCLQQHLCLKRPFEVLHMQTS